MDDLELLKTALPRLKVFPLPTAVLLPHATLSLHIFEPRYRAMTTDALGNDRVLAIAMLGTGWEADYYGRPGMQPIAGAGIIERHEKLPDGRYNLLLRGVARVRILDEQQTDRPYREVRAELAAEIPPKDPSAAEAVRQCVLELCQTLPKSVSGPLATELSRARTPGELCDIAAATLLPDAPQRQLVLEALDVQQRITAVIAELGELILKLRGKDPGAFLM